MSNSIWKMPDQKPDVFKPHTIMVIYEAHNEAELMLSTQYEAYTADRYTNRWCYLDELFAQANKAERLQKALDLALGWLEKVATPAKCDDALCREFTKRKVDEIKQLIK